ncbi:3'-5' exoribonuclease domain-containing protein [Kineobactrum salinum]|uniref:3'-5' exoribonuclease Rv2179c-like domain-containing protein n=1 Tax=Kineobactrum salinum TaxID=2708301 RepID=A0A6C0U705_9GAMM|nr:3'-5' exoribonuclease [Kineobactrum salinum]QIB67119.1 hypothetical protein G3T16_18675 [Kineobactrum salinum]
MTPDTIASMDIETLSTNTNAKILSFGMVMIDPSKDLTFEEICATGIEILFRTDVQADRHESLSTRKWWSEQGPEAQRVLEPGDAAIHPEDFYKALEHYASAIEMQKCRWYTRGPHFDISRMDSLFETYNISAPWKYYKVRDIRTWLEENGLEDNIKLEKPPGMIPHNAMHDAAFDAWMMLQILHGKPLVRDSGKKPPLTFEAMRAIGGAR